MHISDPFDAPMIPIDFLEIIPVMIVPVVIEIDH